MDLIENFKNLGKKENARYLALVLLLLVGVVVLNFSNIVPQYTLVFQRMGIIIFLPYLIFVLFLFLISLFTKKSITEISLKRIFILLIVSIPFFLAGIFILIALFAVSIVSYFFFISWFIIYGSYLVGKNIDTRLKRLKSKMGSALRGILFFGGLATSLFLLFLFIIGPTILDLSGIVTISIPDYLNGVYILVGIILVGLTIICIFSWLNKSFNAWFGIFSILVSVYTLVLVLKIYLTLDIGEETISSIWTNIIMLIIDIFILLYSVSTLLGSQAKLLISERTKSERVGIDSVILWLILSKVAYEFISNYPSDIPGITDILHLIKNILVLMFFTILLIIIGLYEIRKYNKLSKEPKEEASTMEVSAEEVRVEKIGESQNKEKEN